MRLPYLIGAAHPKKRYFSSEGFLAHKGEIASVVAEHTPK